MSRRPQNLASKVFEICEYNVFFAIPMSDNVLRKLRAVHRDLEEPVRALKKKEHKFVMIETGFDPQTFPAIKLERAPTKSKETKKHE